MHFGLEVRRFCAFMSKRRASPILAADVLYLFFAFGGLMSFGGAVGAFSPAPRFFGYTTCQTLTVLAVYSPVVIACIWWIYRPGVKSFLPFSGFIGKISENIRVLLFLVIPPIWMVCMGSYAQHVADAHRSISLPSGFAQRTEIRDFAKAQGFYLSYSQRGSVTCPPGPTWPVVDR
jgi:hypothetical protein